MAIGLPRHEQERCVADVKGFNLVYVLTCRCQPKRALPDVKETRACHMPLQHGRLTNSQTVPINLRGFHLVRIRALTLLPFPTRHP